MELIESKDVRNYLVEIEKGFTDFEKAVLIYNSENRREDIIAELKKLQAETKDERLIQQIEERFQHDEEVLNSLRKADENIIFLLEIYEPEDEQYYRQGCYISGQKQVEKFADAIEASANDRTPHVPINVTYLQGADEILTFMEKRKKMDAVSE